MPFAACNGQAANADPRKGDAAMIDTDNAVSKIKKLMEHAGCEGCTEAEVETYLRKARKMMEEYNLTENDILGQTEEKRENLYESIDSINVFNRVTNLHQFFKDLAGAAAAVCDCKHYTGWRNMPSPDCRNKGKMEDRHCVFIYGLPKDRAVAAELFTILNATMHAMARRGYGSKWGSSHNSYCLGFAGRIRQRAEEMASSSTLSGSEAEQSTAIVLVKGDMLKRYGRDILGLGRGKAGRGHQVKDMSAFARGVSEGNKVHLGRNGLGNSGVSQKLLK